MLRVRFHGRGGHGVKTASRILGTAAFLGGWQAQDSPLYGPERRGAAVAAFTRLDHVPVRERGLILDPDLILVADDTLLADAAAGGLTGSHHALGLFLNTDHGAEGLAERLGLTCPVCALDLTALALEHLGRGSALSAPLGAAACVLVGLPLEDTLEAVRQELSGIGVPPDMIARNVELARRVQGGLVPWPVSPRPPTAQAALLHTPAYAGAAGVPIVCAAGNSPARHTGSWRLVRPVIDRRACTRCGLCFVACPDAVLAHDPQGYPAIDLDNCKGCMVCAGECPLGAIHEQKEVRAW